MDKLKLIFILLSLANANLPKIIGIIEELAKINSTYQDVISILQGQDPLKPTLLPMQARAGISQQLDYLQGYGCWCHFDAEHGIGHGNTVDAYDEACKKLHEGVTCAKKEVKTSEGRQCLPAQTMYMIDAQISTEGRLVYNCEKFNSDPCAINTCFLETHFLSLVLEQALKYRYVPQYEQFSSNNFDRTTCGSKNTDYYSYDDYNYGGNGGSNKVPSGGFRSLDDEEVKITKCCGQYSANTKRPIQFSDITPRECCENPISKDFIVYSTINHECCRDGSIRNVGSCA